MLAAQALSAAHACIYRMLQTIHILRNGRGKLTAAGRGETLHMATAAAGHANFGNTNTTAAAASREGRHRRARTLAASPACMPKNLSCAALRLCQASLPYTPHANMPKSKALFLFCKCVSTRQHKCDKAYVADAQWEDCRRARENASTLHACSCSSLTCEAFGCCSFTHMPIHRRTSGVCADPSTLETLSTCRHDGSLVTDKQKATHA
jgi:hypothetical protein